MREGVICFICVALNRQQPSSWLRNELFVIGQVSSAGWPLSEHTLDMKFEQIQLLASIQLQIQLLDSSFRLESL